MGKAVITLVDTLDDDGLESIHVDMEFDPLINVQEGQATTAQLYALKMLESVAEPEDLDDAAWQK